MPKTLLRTVLDAGRMSAFEWDVRDDDPYFDVVHPADRETLRAVIAALRPESPRLDHQYRIVTGNRTRWIRDDARGEFDTDGNLVRLRGVTADVTQLHDAEARLTLIATVSEWIGTTEDAAELLYEVSRAVGEHLGARRSLFTEIDLEHDRGTVRRDYCRGAASVAGVYRISDYAEVTRREMQAGRTVVNRDSLTDPRTAAEYTKTYQPAGERAYIAVPLLREGRWVAEFWISDDVPRDWSDQEVALLQSVAERTWTAIEKLRVELERRELLSREQRLRAEADQASRAKDHFLALLSHELRTPMTTILGWASFIRSGMADPATAQKGIESIEQASRTQARLIDDLLDVSRIVTGKLALDRKLIDVADAIRSAVEVIQPAAHAASLTLATQLGSGPAFVIGDSMRLQQVIWNLLSNAVKFTPAGGEVTVSVMQSDDGVEIVVRDTGVGIEPDFLPHVFESFRQADDGPTRRFGGLGLGLSIVCYLTEVHGGSVRAASEGAGRGSEFSIRFPRAYPASALPPPRESDPRVDRHALAGVNVLLVDDDPGAREILGTILTGFGATVTPAASAAEAVQHFASAVPDVLVSDIGMPDEDGYALIRRLRLSPSPHASQIPAIAVTAYADPRDRDRALTAGYQAHVTKPVEPHVLAAAVLRVLPSGAR
jgi:signal transduction histidine kinase/CheY-like chemotaxis protein